MARRTETLLRNSKLSQSIWQPFSVGLGQASGEESSPKTKKARDRTENGNYWPKDLASRI